MKNIPNLKDPTNLQVNLQAGGGAVWVSRHYFHEIIVDLISFPSVDIIPYPRKAREVI